MNSLEEIKSMLFEKRLISSEYQNSEDQRGVMIIEYICISICGRYKKHI